METAGNILKATRESQQKTLQKIARNIGINIQYLRAIENEDYSSLPAEVFTKAYISMYAKTLGLDSAYLLNLYKSRNGSAAHKAAKSESDGPFKFLKQTFMEKQKLKPAIVVLAMLLLLLAAITLTMDRNDIEENTIVQPSTIQDVSKAVIDKNPEMHSLKVLAVELTWISVRIDEGKAREWLLKAGEEITLTASRVFALKIGNAGGTRLILNNEEIGAIGPRGKVADIVLPEDIE